MTEPLDDELIVGAAVDVVTALIQSDKLAASDAPDMLARTVTKLRNPESATTSIERRLDTLTGWLEHMYGGNTRQDEQLPKAAKKPKEKKLDEHPLDEVASLFEEEPKKHRKATKAEIEASITPEALICFECGQGFEMLKTHLIRGHGMTREEYEKKWGLPKDYPKMSPIKRELRAEHARRNMGKMEKMRKARTKATA
jgi:predicted transcriptional regulator